MAPRRKPILHKDKDDSSTDDDRIAPIKRYKPTDKLNLVPATEPVTRHFKLVRENARVELELPEEIPDSQESLDHVSDTLEERELDEDSFHTEDTIVLEGGTRITPRPQPKYVSFKVCVHNITRSVSAMRTSITLYLLLQ